MRGAIKAAANTTANTLHVPYLNAASNCLTAGDSGYLRLRIVTLEPSDNVSLAQLYCPRATCLMVAFIFAVDNFCANVLGILLSTNALISLPMENMSLSLPATTKVSLTITGNSMATPYSRVPHI